MNVTFSPSSKKLILNLILATDQGILTTADAVKAAQLFGISATNIRVTLSRLVATGLLTACSRSEYQLSQQGRVLASVVAKWRSAEDGLREWHGEWVVAATGSLSKSDRPALRVRNRAFGLLGFQDLGDGLMVRPDNLKADINSTRQKLTELGVSAEVPIFVVLQFDELRDARARSLWNGLQLEAGYEAEMEKMRQWLRRCEGLPIDLAAREAFLIGDAAILRLVFDPLLPSPLVNEAVRQKFRQELVHFEGIGRQIWRDFLAE